MSQSPITDFSPSKLQQYKNRWGALARLLNADKSFSGRERHSAFLSLKGQRFADISAVSGFDFAEDGRALITEDWDFDGDLDVWVTARTAPRVRLLENTSQNKDQSLFIRLQGNGTTTNAEAIGARCELWLKDDEKPITRTLKGGDSFLSQTGSWLHFGLGNHAKIAKVIIHWPAGDKQVFTDLESGGRYILHQDKPKALKWTPPSKPEVVTKDSPISLPFESDQARIVVISPKLIPALEDKKGSAIDEKLQGPTLVNFWSHTCPSCLDELKEWTNNYDKIKSAGLNILALNVDEISNPTTSEPKDFLSRINCPFPTYSTNEDTLQRLDLFQRSFLDRWLPLPVPSSFLLDKNGKVVVIYKGPVSVETLIADMTLLDATPEVRREHTTPFKGIWVTPPPFTGPKNYIKQLLDHKKLTDVEDYFKRFIKIERKLPNKPTAPFVDALKTLAKLSTQRKEFKKAVTYLEEAVALVPEATDLQVLLKNAQKAEANTIENLLAKVAAEPKNGKAHLALADAQRAQGEAAKAIESYKNALRNDPNLTVAAGKLAWILASHPDPKIRNPKMALGLANRLMDLNGGTDANYFDLQGMAFAANGDFKTAIEVTSTALILLTEETPYKKGVQTRLLLYKEGKPYIEDTIKAKN